MQKEPLLLSIDTSCDETSVAVTRGLKVISNVIASQVDIHRKWGGVVPSLAKREHEANIDQTVTEAVHRAKVLYTELDGIAVTQGPGLAIALEVGIKKAKELAETYKKKLFAINHMEGHLLSPLAQNAKGIGNDIHTNEKAFPMLGFLVSGGHTEIVLVNNIGSYTKIGQTIDDAAGEAFDKFAKMLELGYPGGEIVERFAKLGNPKAYVLPHPMEKSPNFNYSFSGLKTAVLYLIRDLQTKKELSKNEMYDLCASFQEAVVTTLLIKLQKAFIEYRPSVLLCGGGVMANKKLRIAIRNLSRRFNIQPFFPKSKRLVTDNAAMIGVAAYYKYLRGENYTEDINKFDRLPNLSL